MASSEVGSVDGAKKGKKVGQKSYEEIVQGFNVLRSEQRQLAGKLAELEQDINEHKVVIETLQEVEHSRKCFRLVGGVLVQRTVKEVLPALVTNKAKIAGLIEKLTDQLEAKGKELNAYKEKFNIRVRGQEESPRPPSEERGEGESKPSQGVLVASKP